MVIRIASAVLTLAGALALLSGLLFWLGWALQLMSMHMLLGIVAKNSILLVDFAIEIMDHGADKMEAQFVA